MGVAFGQFDPTAGYLAIQNECRTNHVDQSGLTLSVKTESGVVVPSMAVAILDCTEELLPDCIEITILGIPSAFYEALFPDHAINYKTTDFVAEVKRLTGGVGVNVILDMVAGDYVAREVEALAEDGRLVIIAVQGGIQSAFNAGLVLRRRLTITGSTLRPRPVAFKAAIAQSLRQTVWPWIESGRIKPVIHSVFAAAEVGGGFPSGAAQAHALMETNQHVGKIVVTW